ncbi:type I-E CRISPR-associated protein Cse1/CasA [Luteipulveratus mongoliensis]|uniref:type I-E CRISPR-associated protein Cse1/CasA n=1 Tax=Luteipulveratus mongoliensis TaxID=571913 RepID=UPI00069646E8|nr:type I-E CRISPR-associated protein Cse1/CasA [Luteipulveratus mongoliensis]
MAESSFDLLTQPWVAVRDDDGVHELSLIDTFARAHELTGLAGELATQDLAVLRLLLVILRRTMGSVRGDGEAIDRWAEWWQAESLPTPQIDAYLAGCSERFDLLHPTTPFMQVAGLEAGKTSGLVKLIGDVPDGHRYFTLRSGAGLRSLSYAEAARWVVHCQAFDPSGIKSGALDDGRTKGGRGYPIGTGWTGRCGLVVMEGANLKETLLLNLRLDPDDAPEDRPVWEREIPTETPDPMHVVAAGPCDLMTWPIRRIRLIHNGSEVTDAIIANGTPVQWHNQHRLETMTAWRRSSGQEKKHGVPAYMPHEHDANRSFWRGLQSLMVTGGERRTTSNDAEQSLPPRTLDWIATLQADDALDVDHPTRMRAIGMVYGSNSSVVASVVDDALQLRLSVLTDSDLEAEVVAALRAADEGVQALANLAANLARASGALPEEDREAARAQGYYGLDQGFRRWVSTLSTRSDPTERRTAWQSYVHHTLGAMGDALVTASGDQVWRGRLVTQTKGGERLVNAPVAHLWFTGTLRSVLPAANQVQPSDRTTPESADV